MSKLNGSAIIAAGIRGCICASVATAITALLSWTFVVSTDTLTWPGSSTLQAWSGTAQGEMGILALG